jgi:Cu+-exporting ATPase
MNVHHDPHSPGHHAAPPTGAVKDVVCGMMVDPQATVHRATHAGADYFFCSAGCRKKFEADPARYVAAESSAPDRTAGQIGTAPAPAGTIYTCPMHPEIRQPGPGSCPI